MECDPGLSAAVVSDAMPPVIAAEPNAFVPSVKATDPVGVPVPPIGATVAINVIGIPYCDGFGLALKVVAVQAGQTTIRKIVPSPLAPPPLAVPYKFPSAPSVSPECGVRCVGAREAV